MKTQCHISPTPCKAQNSEINVFSSGDAKETELLKQSSFAYFQGGVHRVFEKNNSQTLDCQESTSSHINFLSFQDHKNKLTKFFYKLCVLLFRKKDLRERVRKSQANQLAMCIKKNVLNINLDTLENAKNPVLNAKDIILTLEKIENKFCLIKYNTPASQKGEVLYSFNDTNDPQYIMLKKSTEEFLETSTTLFNSRLNGIRPKKSGEIFIQKKTDLTILMGGTAATAERVRNAFRIQENEDNILVYGGPNVFASNIQQQVDEIKKALEGKELPDGSIISIWAHSRGCFKALEICKLFPKYNFRLFLADPTKGPILNPILTNKVIPKNVRSCVLNYAGKPRLGILDKTILTLEDPDSTILEVNINLMFSHNSGHCFNLGMIQKNEDPQNKITLYDYGQILNQSSNFRPNQKVINTLSEAERVLPITKKEEGISFLFSDGSSRLLFEMKDNEKSTPALIVKTIQGKKFINYERTEIWKLKNQMRGL